MKRVLFLWVSIVLFCCNHPERTNYITLRGLTMGTTYNISYKSKGKGMLQTPIDSVLRMVNLSMSTYIDSSTISRFNNFNGTVWFPVDNQFSEVFTVAKEVYRNTGGAFDPTVMPLVRTWGFAGDKEREPLDSNAVDSLLKVVGFDLLDIKYQNDSALIRKKNPQCQLDFSAIAKGYGVDKVAEFLESRQIENYMVEIGGEVRAKGKNKRGILWQIGIDKPLEDQSQAEGFQAILKLNDEALATSGNYRNFYIKDGKKYVHTINPKTGYPEINNTLSVSVLAKDCAIADAYATAFMVLGVEKGLQLAESIEEIEVYFVFSDDENFNTEMTSGFRDKIVLGTEVAKYSNH